MNSTKLIKKFYSRSKKYPSFIKTLYRVNGKNSSEKIKNINRVLNKCKRLGISLLKKNGKDFKSYRGLLSSCDEKNILKRFGKSTGFLNGGNEQLKLLSIEKNQLISELNALKNSKSELFNSEKELLLKELESNKQLLNDEKNQLINEKQLLISELENLKNSENSQKELLLKELDSVKNLLNDKNEEINTLKTRIDNLIVQRNSALEEFKKVNNSLLLRLKLFAETIKLKAREIATCKAERTQLVNDLNEVKLILQAQKNKLPLTPIPEGNEFGKRKISLNLKTINKYINYLSN